MKQLIVLLLLLPVFCFGQNVQVDSQTYTAQQLIEDILIDSNCIDNVVVTNVVGGDFNSTDQSYGYFDATGTSFPFNRGIVLSTGRLANVQGPNTTLSDDDAPNWNGDTDLEFALQENNTTNATIIEFEFTAIANSISFRYLFASEEYQENNANTCQYSDLFGFLIRSANQMNYTNIALVPGTTTPVKVTTVHPEIPGGCPAINETYFGSFNNATAPINFNGQTTVLTATANVIPNETYHVKLVIADEQNFRYDSAVFLEAGSFELHTDLGNDRLLATNNPLCENESLTLDATNPGSNNTYRWFRNGTELTTETNPILTVTDAGQYNVEVTINGSCVSYGEITIEYATNPVVSNTQIVECDPDNDGFTVYNLTDAYVTTAITSNDPDISIVNYYESLSDAQQDISPITNASAFPNTSINQIIYARIENQYGCFTISEIALQTSTNLITIPSVEQCDDISNDGIFSFNLDDIRAIIAPLVPANSDIFFYESLSDIFNNGTALNTNYENTTPYNQTIYADVINNDDCYTIIEVPLVVYDIPELSPDETVKYCINNYPYAITLNAGDLNIPIGEYHTYLWNTGKTTGSIVINQLGTYTVTVTNFNGCSNTRTIIVEASNTATIDDVIVEELSPNNSITVMVSGEGDYEFSLNLGLFQDSNTFTNVSPGFHTVYVRDKFGCGITEQIVSVLGFPKFFTPNGDGYKDTWQVFGVGPQFNKGTFVKIFDRHGMLVAAFDNNSIGWDGTLNGKALPSSDYWFVIRLSNGKEYKGHFALVR